MQNSFAEFRIVSTYKLQKFAERLKERRDALGFSNEQLARMAGIGARSVYDYLDQTTTPKGDTIVKLSEVLQCDIGWLFGEERASAPVTDPAHCEEVLELSERLEQMRAAIVATQAVVNTMSQGEAASSKPLKRVAPADLKRELMKAHPLRAEVSERKSKAASPSDSKPALRPPASKRPSTPPSPPAPVPVGQEF